MFARWQNFSVFWSIGKSSPDYHLRCSSHNIATLVSSTRLSCLCPVAFLQWPQTNAVRFSPPWHACLYTPLPCASLAHSGTSLAEVKLFIPCGDTAFLSLRSTACPMLGWHMLASSWQTLYDNSCRLGLLFCIRLEQAIPAHLSVGTSLAATQLFNPRVLCLGQIPLSLCICLAQGSSAWPLLWHRGLQDYVLGLNL